MSGYIKTSIDFNKIENKVEAAKALDNSGDTDRAKEVLKELSDSLKEETK